MWQEIYLKTFEYASVLTHETSMKNSNYASAALSTV